MSFWGISNILKYLFTLLVQMKLTVIFKKYFKPFFSWFMRLFYVYFKYNKWNKNKYFQKCVENNLKLNKLFQSIVLNIFREHMHDISLKWQLSLNTVIKHFKSWNYSKQLDFKFKIILKYFTNKFNRNSIFLPIYRPLIYL